MSGESRAVTDVFVAVGSNIDPERNVVAALAALLARETVVGCSTFYRTPPVARPDQPWFANGVWRLRSFRPPQELKDEVLREVERRCGRVRGEDRHAARTIDLDLILYGDRVVATDTTVLPDPEIRRRAFLAVPLLDLVPDLVLPDTGEALGSLPIARRDAALEVLEELTLKLKGMIES